MWVGGTQVPARDQRDQHAHTRTPGRKFRMVHAEDLRLNENFLEPCMKLDEKALLRALVRRQRLVANDATLGHTVEKNSSSTSVPPLIKDTKFSISLCKLQRGPSSGTDFGSSCGAAGVESDNLVGGKGTPRK